jgi:Ca-activated chloride channel family protein
VNMSFLRPENLNLGWLLLLLVFCSAFALRSLRNSRLRLGRAGLALTSRPSSLTRRALKHAAGVAVAACLVLALARPQTISEQRVSEMRRMDVVLLLDTSPSMRARDIAPSRLTRATEVIAEFIEKKLPEDRFGLVSFADSSLVLSYLTADPNNVLFYLEYIREQGVLQYGTNIGGALKNGLQVLSRQEEIDPEAKKNKKVFVLLSDGEDHGEDLDAAIAESVRRAVPVYCVGIGSREGAYIPIGEENGKTIYLTGKNDERILTTFDETSLRRIAEKTGGLYYRAHTGVEMSRAFTEIFLKTREIEGFRRVRKPQEHYRDLLAAAFGLFLLRVLI